MQSLLYAAQAQNKSIDRHANVREMKLSPWFGQNPSTSHFTKNCTRQLTNWQINSTAKQGALHKILKIVCVSFVGFVSFKIEIPHDGIPHSCNMTASNEKTEMCQSPIACAQAALSPISLMHTNTARNSIDHIWQIYHTSIGHRSFNLAMTSDIGLRYAHASQKSAFASRSPVLRDDHGTLP